jgi:hypothetical protein
MSDNAQDRLGQTGSMNLSTVSNTTTSGSNSVDSNSMGKTRHSETRHDPVFGAKRSAKKKVSKFSILRSFCE